MIQHGRQGLCHLNLSGIAATTHNGLEVIHVYRTRKIVFDHISKYRGGLQAEAFGSLLHNKGKHEYINCQALDCDSGSEFI